MYIRFPRWPGEGGGWLCWGLLRISSNGDDEMGAKSKPKKIRGPKIPPPPPQKKKFHAEFPNLKKSSKTNLVILHLQNYVAWVYAGATTNLQIVLNTPQNLYLNQATPKKILSKFPYPKNSQNGRFQTQKNPSIIPMT